MNQRLPRGRHQLSRDEVASAQRDRILTGIAAAMAEKGFAATSVADILKKAGVGRETFYEQFKSKHDCFEAAFDDIAMRLFAALTSAFRPDDDPVQRFDRLLGAYLDLLADNPDLARVFLIEVYAAGPAAMDHRAASQRRFVNAITMTLGVADDDARFTFECLIAAISSMVTARIAANDVDGLRALQPKFTKLVATALANKDVLR